MLLGPLLWNVCTKRRPAFSITRLEAVFTAHRLGEDALGSELAERQVDERPAALGGIAEAPGRDTQPVSELRLSGVLSSEGRK